MTRVTPRRPSGFVEYLPGEQLEFNRLLGIITRTYQKYGFAPLDTPDIELSDVLLAKGGGETEQQVYRFKREGSDTDLTLRYDLTVPLARYVAEHESHLTFPFRRYHIGKVHRAERAQAGRFREFYQCDIDVIGSNSPVVDAELPAVINDIFEQFGFGEFIIRINNRQLLSGLLEHLDLSAQAPGILHAIDKIEKISASDFKLELSKAGATSERIEQLVAFTSLTGTTDEVLAELERLGVHNQAFTTGLGALRELVTALRAMGVPEHRFKIDPKIVRGLDYYTGTVYETFLVDYPQIGSVCSGGRYDDLASYYTKTQLSGVGISIGLTRLFYALQQEGAIKSTAQSPASVIVIPVDAAQYDYAIRAAGVLRAAGIATVLYTESDQLSKKLRYAGRMGFEHVIVIGGREVEAETVSLRTMSDHSDQVVPLSKLAAHFA